MSELDPGSDRPVSPALRYFLFGAMAFYEGAPWDVVPSGVPLELEIPPGSEPVYAMVFGGTDDLQGLAIYFDAGEVARFYAGTGEAPADKLSVHLNAVPGTDRAPPVVAPVGYRFLPGGGVRQAGEPELGFAAVGMTAVHEFVAKWARQIAGWVFVQDEILTGEGEHQHAIARVAFPARLPHAPEDEERLRLARAAFAPSAPDVRRRHESAVALREHIQGIPAASPALVRLMWSFFRHAGPVHVDEGDPRDQAITRFLDWALFFAPVPPDGRTLADQWLERVGRGLGQDLDFWTGLCHPRYVWADVTRALPGKGLEVRDRASGEDLWVRALLDSYRMRAGWSFIGTLFPAAPDTYVIDMVSPFGPVHRLPDDAIAVGHGADMAPALEAVLFGASAGWIDRLPDLEWAGKAYGWLAEAIPDLPPFTELARDVAAAASPEQAAAPGVERVSWWTAEEPRIYRRFVDRLWALGARQH